ncbi:ultraviolet-B receptor UVR8 isoform X1 [Arabidopsis lyrata subsp. lyrata]|uniref:ultraviolet-B receptor UVR8 isoform X1 n=1 Tax=Arabidopsis lyrata subsp. lyrata TaxID=81972 RepID=UPI000A29BEB3|nr:ultraviolet-B receptor UVR8 isoform X1 [Arabidopsis lyrata subsp. lyrata]XP_020890758.1 ultraviolet-B receptor UVR8 isoform X1 [Arabidopsis lyrata subsp. lyrata]XP_020890759.1 ultraviolet-B receptor UVR8 isoform X1 [Arabidopsis lyrata subsp. lyrata]XP_020890760.1 ultraviolet-B receptor UVR8 isoform X1 [Arabidopsis lyrata subsp. lyrata]XP_020890761.1 ultraviolet-B receptor UVR8 isoform X1 [Arabidopsis lyrata subsp. lyrata]|eukprot:XP_020890756.1 ultraviolet-B receptor UVR8 isoform X1 [Arabidopsis lyrata subsp. lyrata]
MDTTTSSGSSPATLQLHSIIPENPIAALELSFPPFLRLKRQCLGSSVPGEFFLASCPSIVLHVLTTCDLGPRDLAKLEATCSFFRKPANFSPDFDLSISEVAALDICQKRAIFKCMGEEERQEIKRRCGGSWKLVLKFLLAGEFGCRREKSQALAGPGHSIAVTSKGVVYSFGFNGSGQLGQGTTQDSWQPLPVRSLNGIRIIQAAISTDRTFVISDAGEVYAFGKVCFSEAKLEVPETKLITTPQRVKSLAEIFVVQAAIGNYFTAILSREGRVYTLSWGNDERLGHQTDHSCSLPQPLLGALENIPVVQIAAGFCYLLALAFQPTGMSVYSVGCGLGGKLGHGLSDSDASEKYPRLIKKFGLLNIEPVMVSAGPWHAAVVGKDGRVCTWGWGRFGCLGHGTEEAENAPKVVDGLKDVKAVHVATGVYTTFVVSDDGQVYSFGSGGANLGQQDDVDENTLTPKLVSSLKDTKERMVHVSLTNSGNGTGHTFAMTESGTLYAFGAGNRGQLGVELGENLTERAEPAKVAGIDLS